MLMAGDERNRTQQGNNNAYCQDNAISWVDWAPDPSADRLTAAVRSLISLRAGVPALRAARFPEPGPQAPDEPVPDTGLAWFNPDGSPASDQDWGNASGHGFAVVFPDAPPAPSVLVMVNAYWGPLPFTVPAPPAGTWTVRADTMQEDAAPAAAAPLAAGASIIVGPRSMIIPTGLPCRLPCYQ